MLLDRTDEDEGLTLPASKTRKLLSVPSGPCIADEYS